MLSGNACWSTRETAGMSWRQVGERRVLTFDTMPATYYMALRTSAAAAPRTVAIIDDDGAMYTYERLLVLTDGVASSLWERFGIARGARVGLVLDTSIEYVCAFFACNKLGATCVPLSTKYREDEVVSQVACAHLDLLLLDTRFEVWDDHLAREAGNIVLVDRSRGFGLATSDGPSPLNDDASAVAAMLFTSGTTSRAKGVLLSKVGIMHAAVVYARLEGTTPADVTVIPVPIYHVTGLFALLVQYVYAGATVVLHARFNARRVLEAVRDLGITHIHAAPTALARLLELKDEFPALPSLRLILTGSSTASASLLRQWHGWLPTCTFKTVYGLTETSSPACVFPADAPTSVYIGSSGKPVPGMELDIVDEAGGSLPAGQVGEVLVRGTPVALGYEFAEGSAGALHAFSPDGWFRTGDMGYVNDEGLLWIVSRKKDVINRGGEKIWCCSLDEQLRSIDGIVDACVAGMPDDVYGEVACAAVVRGQGSGLDEDDVKALLKDRVARFEIPERIVFVSEIPQTAGDKQDRRAVRELVLSAIQKEDKQ